MITVTNEMTCGNFEYASGEMTLRGDFKVKPENGKVDYINISINRGGMDIGNAYANKEQFSLKFSYNNIRQEDAETVVATTTALVNELEMKYKPANI